MSDELGGRDAVARRGRGMRNTEARRHRGRTEPEAGRRSVWFRCGGGDARAWLVCRRRGAVCSAAGAAGARRNYGIGWDDE